MADCGPAGLEGAIAETCRSLDDNLGRLPTQPGRSRRAARFPKSGHSLLTVKKQPEKFLAFPMPGYQRPPMPANFRRHKTALARVDCVSRRSRI